MTRLSLAAALVLLPTVLSACGDGSGDGGDGDSSGDVADADPPMGAWFYAEGPNISDSCMVEGFTVSASTEFGLTNHGDGTFTVQREGQDIECSISGQSFTCLPVALDPVPVPNLDATFDLDVTYSGDFDSDTSITGQRDIDVTCTGAACDAVAAAAMTSFPCALVDAFTATYG